MGDAPADDRSAGLPSVDPDASPAPRGRHRVVVVGLGAVAIVAVTIAVLLTQDDDVMTQPAPTSVVQSSPTNVTPAEPADTTSPAIGATRSEVDEPDTVKDEDPTAHFTFEGPDDLAAFRWGVYHRNIGHQEAGQPPVIWGDGNAMHGGSWTGDHDRSCGPPTSQRSLMSTKDPDFGVDDVVYVCRNHLMTSMGDVDGYSIVWFSPDTTFETVSVVCVDVNLTDLGTRQWWKIGVVSDRLFSSDNDGVPGFLMSDVGAADLPGHLVGPDHLIVSWSGGASAGYPGGLKIGDTSLGGDADARSDKATRHPVCVSDDTDGTVTLEVADQSVSTAGSFPACPCRVVFYDHNYTPDKNEAAPGLQYGYTWHWDNIVIR